MGGRKSLLTRDDIKYHLKGRYSIVAVDIPDALLVHKRNGHMMVIKINGSYVTLGDADILIENNQCKSMTSKYHLCSTDDDFFEQLYHILDNDTDSIQRMQIIGNYFYNEDHAAEFVLHYLWENGYEYQTILSHKEIEIIHNKEKLVKLLFDIDGVSTQILVKPLGAGDFWVDLARPDFFFILEEIIQQEKVKLDHTVWAIG